MLPSRSANANWLQLWVCPPVVHTEVKCVCVQNNAAAARETFQKTYDWNLSSNVFPLGAVVAIRLCESVDSCKRRPRSHGERRGAVKAAVSSPLLSGLVFVLTSDDQQKDSLTVQLQRNNSKTVAHSLTHRHSSNHSLSCNPVLTLRYAGSSEVSLGGIFEFYCHTFYFFLSNRLSTNFSFSFRLDAFRFEQQKPGGIFYNWLHHPVLHCLLEV